MTRGRAGLLHLARWLDLGLTKMLRQRDGNDADLSESPAPYNASHASHASQQPFSLGKERAFQLPPGSFLAANNLSRRSVKLVFTGILSDAVPERPILLLDLNEAHQDVLATQTRVSGEIVRDCGEQRLLLIKRAWIVTGNLNHR
jgi:hypothetical protein